MQRPWPYPRILAHRGGGKLAPENTLAGFRKAAELGFGGVELDVMLTADAVPVVIHDETLERTTDGRGEVAKTSRAALELLDAGAWFGPAYKGERVPAFEQVGKLCVDLGLWANVEIKPAQGFERETGAATAALARNLWRDVPLAPILSSFQPAALEAARGAAPELLRGFLTDRIEPGWRTEAARLECVSVHTNCRDLTAAHAKEIRDAGYWLLCYTVNEPDTARKLFSWGVDAIFTDRLDLIPPDFPGASG
jgi:glycerophosphoryl diester phosphodiesterase